MSYFRSSRKVRSHYRRLVENRVTRWLPLVWPRRLYGLDGQFQPCQVTGEANCPGLNEFTISVIGFQDAGGVGVGPQIGRSSLLDVQITIDRLSFGASTPLLLVTGCCNEAPDFWNPADLRPDTLKSYFVSRGLPFGYANPSDKGKYSSVSGTIPEGGAMVLNSIRKSAQELGVHQVVLIAHSKGGLWSRFAGKLGAATAFPDLR